MKKAFDQTIRDLKRGVNKKVLKVPSVEQKILDATSNEPWGPHGSLLIDIAQATRNYHEYQIIMTVIWKRISSTGKNWRHVYKALTVLEFLVANGSERVVDEIREHAYQVSTLSNFQYIDSSGRDQGLNVRRKSQSLVSLVNDKERIQEVREKAATNRDKFKSASTGSGSYSGSGYGDRYDDERYGSRDEDRNGYGREGDWNRDDDKYGRHAEPYAHNSDRYNRDSEERYGRGSYGDDEYRGRHDENQDGSRSSNRDRDRAYDDEHQSSRSSSVKAEDHPQEGRPLDRKFSEQSPGAPPSYEDAVGGSKSPVSSGRDEETPSAPILNSFSPTTIPSPGQTTEDPSSSWSDLNHKAEAVDKFDPRCSQDAAVSGTSNNAETDLLGSLSDAWAITPASSAMPSADSSASGPFGESNFMATSSSPATLNQSFEDPFGDSPFKAVSSEVSDSLSGLTFQLPQNSHPMQQEPLSFQNDDILAGILPPSASQAPFLPTANQPIAPVYSAPDFGYSVPNFEYSAPNFVPHSGHPPPTDMTAQNLMMQVGPTISHSSQPTSTLITGSLALVSQPTPQEKFELKSAVWADTLNRGLVNLNISGPKVNPNAGIGVDFESLNRKEKRMEKPTTSSVTSTINMGKAMGAGSGIGRSGTNTLRPQSNPMMTPGIGMGMGGAGGGGVGMGMGGYGMMNQGPGMGVPMQPSNGLQPGLNVSGGYNYNPMMGRGGGYSPQNPYGSGYQ